MHQQYVISLHGLRQLPRYRRVEFREGALSETQKVVNARPEVGSTTRAR